MNDVDEISGPLPPVLFLGALLGMVAAHYMIPLAVIFVAGWRWLGLPFVVVGVSIIACAVRHFTRAGTALKPTEPSTSLVVTGPFSFSRNPMYLGMICIIVGAAISFGSATPWVFVPMFIWSVSTKFITPEERKMEHAFGERYLAYKRRVRRWL